MNPGVNFVVNNLPRLRATVQKRSGELSRLQNRFSCENLRCERDSREQRDVRRLEDQSLDGRCRLVGPKSLVHTDH
jgi:hypothetical protein